MLIFLCNFNNRVRSHTADELNLALMMYGDQIFEATEEGERKNEEALAILSETDWRAPVATLKPIRNNLCLLLGLAVPICGTKQ